MESELLPSNTRYRTAIGKLLYLTTITQVDIATAAGTLSREVSLPTQNDWNVIKRVAKYLKGTMG